jgi:hypothetical protein
MQRGKRGEGKRGGGEGRGRGTEEGKRKRGEDRGRGLTQYTALRSLAKVELDPPSQQKIQTPTTTGPISLIDFPELGLTPQKKTKNQTQFHTIIPLQKKLTLDDVQVSRLKSLFSKHLLLFSFIAE